MVKKYEITKSKRQKRHCRVTLATLQCNYYNLAVSDDAA